MNKFIKDFCLELDITQKTLSELVGVSEGTVNRWSSNPNKIPKHMKRMLFLLLENHKLKTMLKSYKDFNDSVNGIFPPVIIIDGSNDGL